MTVSERRIHFTGGYHTVYVSRVDTAFRVYVITRFDSGAFYKPDADSFTTRDEAETFAARHAQTLCETSEGATTIKTIGEITCAATATQSA